MLRNIEASAPCAENEAGSQGDFDVLLPNATIIKQSTVACHLEARELLNEAKAHAKECIARAEKEAERIKALGFRQGLQEGIGAALSPISAMISQWEHVRATLRKDAEIALRHCTQDLATREPMLSTLIDMALQAHVARPPTCVTVRVPPGADGQALQDRCVALGLTAKIEFGESLDVISVGWDGHVWTAHLGDIADLAMAGERQAADDADLSPVEKREICRRALVDVMNRWPSDTGEAQEPG